MQPRVYPSSRPFNSVGRCPACETKRDHLTRLAFCDVEHVRAAGGWIDTSTVSSARPVGHMHVRCDRCRFEWIEATASDVEPYR